MSSRALGHLADMRLPSPIESVALQALVVRTDQTLHGCVHHGQYRARLHEPSLIRARCGLRRTWVTTIYTQRGHSITSKKLARLGGKPSRWCIAVKCWRQWGGIVVSRGDRLRPVGKTPVGGAYLLNCLGPRRSIGNPQEFRAGHAELMAKGRHH